MYDDIDEYYHKPIRNGEKDKLLSIKEYLDMIIKLSHKTQGEWKIQLTSAINFMSSKDSNKTRPAHSNSENIETVIGSETDEIIEELFESLLQRYQEGLE